MLQPLFQYNVYMFVLNDFKAVLSEGLYSKFITNNITSINEHQINILLTKRNKWYEFAKPKVSVNVCILKSGEIIIELIHKYFAKSKVGVGFNLYSCPKSVVMDCSYFLNTFPFPLTHEWEFKKGLRGFYYQYWIAFGHNSQKLYWNKDNSALLIYWISQFIE